MKRYCLFVLLYIFLLVVLAGCTEIVIENTDAPSTDIPTEAKTDFVELPTSVMPVTEEPIVQPTEQPTEAPTEEPTQIPYVFEDDINIVMYEGQIRQLYIGGDQIEKSVKIVSSDNSVIAPANDNYIKAIKEGKAEVKISLKDGKGETTYNIKVVKEYILDKNRYDVNGLPVYEPKYEEGVNYVDFPGKEVRHLFTHNLVGFEDKTDLYYSDCVTKVEFTRMLEQMYQRGYILIDIDYMYDYYFDEKGILSAKVKKNIKVPDGKIPFIISVDNVAYPRSEHGLGRSDKLIVKDGELYTLTKLADGTEYYSQDNEVFTIIEGFVKEHPDFSLFGAKCVVAPSGYEGLFGWDTQPSKNNAKAVSEARKVAKWFVEHGFTIQCHSFYHKNFNKVSQQQVEKDFLKWMSECYPIVGKTHIYILPFGDNPSKGSSKAYTMKEEGYPVFCGTSMYWENSNNYPVNGMGYNTRIIITAQMLYNYRDKKVLTQMFDPYTVYDNSAHKKKIGGNG